MFDRIIAWSLQNRIIVLLLYVVTAGIAIVLIPTMSVDVFPEFAPPQVQIQTETQGLSAKDTEALVTVPIEVVLRGMPDVAQVRSNSSIGLSRITVVFRSGIDVFRARSIAQERLQLVKPQLPAGISVPELMPTTSAVSWLQKFALIDWSPSADNQRLRSLVDWDLRNRLLSQPGVASMVSIGGGVRQYQVEVDVTKLNSFGLPFSSVVEAGRQTNIVASGAFVYPTREEEYFLRANGLVNRLQDIGLTAIAVRDGVPITLNDIAKVKIGDELKRGDAQVFGTNAVVGTISKQWGADTLGTTRHIEEALREFSKALPSDIQLIPDVFRQASFIERSISNLQDALLHSSIVVALVLFLFMARWRPTIISLIAIPASLMIGGLVLWVLGAGINALTLGGLVFAVGEVVDDSIIDVENIVRLLREHEDTKSDEPKLSVVLRGSREIRNSVVFATLIVIVSFLPIFALSDIEGRIFAPMAIAYISAVASSLLVALTLVPVLCYYLLAHGTVHVRYRGSLLTRTLKRHYQKSLDWAIARTGFLLAFSVIVSVAAVLLTFSLGRSFLPELAEGNIVIATTMNPGTSLEENMRVGRAITSTLNDIPEIKSVAHRAGRSRLDEDAQPVNFAEYDVALQGSVTDAARVMRRIREKLSKMPGLVVNVSQFIVHRMQEILSGVRAEVVVKIFGSDIGELQEKQHEVMNAVAGIAGIVDLQAEPMILGPGIDVRVDRRAASLHGLTPLDVTRQVGEAMNGVSVSRILENDKAFDLVVRADERSRKNIESIGDFSLRSPQGAIVPLRQLATISEVREPFFINRDDGARRAVVQWNIQGRDLNSVVQEARAMISDKVSLKPGMTIEFGGDYVAQQRATRNLLLYGAAAFALICVLMFAAFRRTLLAGLVLLNLPFAAVGGAIALVVTGSTLNIPSLVGMIVLIGIAARNSILLLSRYEQLSDSGLTDAGAIARSGASDRMLPIMMTALTTGLAVVPLLLGDPVGKELQRPMAIVLLGGMASSTLLSLFVLPASYVWISSRWPELRGSRKKAAGVDV
ncbi:efflux RND transporter permease subunit [Bradyrhizobium sp. HKCCYLS20291]|uniref:efflux RND transporter permease subunit n=1 Tax=Bradyrhizobium sp. HKCCYLS20291 TaxID=3420766 RepID=UPI003EBA404C